MQVLILKKAESSKKNVFINLCSVQYLPNSHLNTININTIGKFQFIYAISFFFYLGVFFT